MNATRCLLLALVLTACRAPAEQDEHAAAADSTPVVPSVQLEPPPDFASIRTLPAAGVTGPGGVPFAVQVREPALHHAPCSSCHEGARPTPASGEDRTHADVVLDHPREPRAPCAGCHDASDPARLVLIDGNVAPLEEAYRLCAQCHSSQAKDWAGGAHGKRLAGWRGPRAVLNCTGCHDPHRPRFEKRMPVQYPHLPRPRGAH